MELVQALAANIEGVEGFLVQVEVSRAEPTVGIGRTSVVGLPDAERNRTGTFPGNGADGWGIVSMECVRLPVHDG